MINRLIDFIKRFCYYGYHGAKYTRDFDANGVHSLIHAHISRVDTFMHNPKLTHLVWNSDHQNKNMRLLREFKELSSRMKDEFDIGYYTTRVFDAYREDNDGMWLFENRRDPKFRKAFKIARKKDAIISRGLEDRYWYLFREKVPEFWD